MVSYGDWELRIHEIKGKMDRVELIPDPDWQRGYIWNRKDGQHLTRCRFWHGQHDRGQSE